MGIRDQEIERIVKYANGLGIKVVWKKYVRGGGADASWHLDGSTIEMFTWSRKSKTQIILDFIHELGHHMGWVYAGRKNDMKTDAAYEADAAREKGDPPLSKAKRRLIYDAERRDANYRAQIFKELGIKIPRWRLEADIAYDLWIYKRYWMTGKIPTIKQMGDKKSELNKRFKGKYEAENRV